MEINWVTVAAQTVNFLILVWLLHKFLYGPVMKAMAAREEKIHKRKAEADAEKEAAENTRQGLEADQAKLAAERKALLEDAHAEAEKVRHQLEAEARAETDTMRRAWLEQLASEQTEFLTDVRGKGADAIVEICRTALKELAGEDLERRIVAAFSGKLDAMPADVRKKVAAAGKRHDGTVTVESAFPLSKQDKQQITESLHTAMDPALKPKFEAADDLLAGIRLRADSQVIEWSFNSFLDQLTNRIEEALAGETARERRAAAE
ncbi:F0F1 ATP synthase subunit delta [Henriciella aquimarina]|uniref:F0F1 ATP synthase subunit delta n=1 Tax=Henriciella aquimarina TaxID=545261 RepID=UPI0009FEED49|nr:F0F1 ATP synthase subunit delta [Henriciella aquimarina]